VGDCEEGEERAERHSAEADASRFCDVAKLEDNGAGRPTASDLPATQSQMWRIRL